MEEEEGKEDEKEREEKAVLKKSMYYLRNKKVSTRLHVYLRLESANHQKRER